MWEYEFLPFRKLDQLDQLGREGWEAVCAIPVADAPLLLKRPLTGHARVRAEIARTAAVHAEAVSAAAAPPEQPVHPAFISDWDQMQKQDDDA